MNINRPKMGFSSGIIAVILGFFIDYPNVLAKDKDKGLRIALSAAFVSYNGVAVYEKIAAYIEEKTQKETDIVTGLAYETINALLTSGSIDAAFICGYPYVILNNDTQKKVELIAAPVMSSSRYGNKPIYYSDLIVAKGSSIESLKDLKNKVFVYNEELSNSGYIMPRFHFKKNEIDAGYFAKIKRSGSHEESIRMVAEGEADFSFVDSLVIDYDREKKLGHAHKVKVIESLGPAGIPPVVVSTKIDSEIKKALKTILLNMHRDKKGKTILKEALVSHFTEIEGKNYTQIRHWDEQGKGLSIGD